VLTAKGWKAVKVAGDLTQPRGIVFDSAGNLLVVQNGLGITAHTIDSNGCLSSQTTVVSQRNLNHGIVLSHDGKTLYASSATQVYAWTYDAATRSVGPLSRIVIGGMDSKGHVTRTLAIPPKHPDLLVVSHGSNDNFDYDAGNMATGRSCVKVFDTTKIPVHGHDYPSGGYQMGYGLRNGVGLAFDANGMYVLLSPHMSILSLCPSALLLTPIPIGSGKSKTRPMNSTAPSPTLQPTSTPTTPPKK
jgi:glucose/arabinose dehydrogenase